MRSITPTTIKRLITLIASFALLGITPASAVQLQETFDPMPSELPNPQTYIKTFTAPSGRIVNYTTLGPNRGRPVLVLNGSPSNWASIDLFAPYASMLKELNLRLIQPERVGYGVTPNIECSAPYTDCMTPAKYANDWPALMHSLGYRSYSVFAASQGGQYADWLMKTHSDEVRSLHLSSAVDTSPQGHVCPVETPTTYKEFGDWIISDPAQTWNFFPARDTETLLSIPGASDWFLFTTAANQDGSGLALDAWIECNFPVGDLSEVQTPVYIYHGALDTRLPIDVA